MHMKRQGTSRQPGRSCHLWRLPEGRRLCIFRRVPQARMFRMRTEIARSSGLPSRAGGLNPSHPFALQHGGDSSNPLAWSLATRTLSPLSCAALMRASSAYRSHILLPTVPPSPPTTPTSLRPSTSNSLPAVTWAHSPGKKSKRQSAPFNLHQSTLLRNPASPATSDWSRTFRILERASPSSHPSTRASAQTCSHARGAPSISSAFLLSTCPQAPREPVGTLRKHTAPLPWLRTSGLAPLSDYLSVTSSPLTRATSLASPQVQVR
jgi:hypothetical protein